MNQPPHGGEGGKLWSCVPDRKIWMEVGLMVWPSPVLWLVEKPHQLHQPHGRKSDDGDSDTESRSEVS